MLHGYPSTGLYSLMISLPRWRKPVQVPYNASPYPCDRRVYLPSQPAPHFARLVRPLENYFTCSWQDPAPLALPLLACPPSCTEGWSIWPSSCCHGTPCPARVSLLSTCGQAVPGSPAPRLCRLHSQLAPFLSVS